MVKCTWKRLIGMAIITVCATTGLIARYEMLIRGQQIQPTCRFVQQSDISPSSAAALAKVETRRRRDWDDSTVTEPCRAVLNGNSTRMKELAKNGDFPWRESVEDAAISMMAKDCELLKQRYRFPPYFSPNISTEEIAFPIAYSIIAHKNANQILMLLSAIYRDHNIHCLHMDAKTSQETHEAVLQATTCFPNVFLSIVRINVRYAHVSRLLADIACMKDLLALPKQIYNWKYLINLCSQDFPTRTNLEIVRQLKEFRGLNSIGGYSEISDETKKRTQYVWKLSNVTRNGVTEQRPVWTNEVHTAPPFNMTVAKCLAYNFYTREFLQWALIDSKVGPALLEWSKDTYSPDEHFWLMLHRYPGAPGGSEQATGYQIARKILWGHGNRKTSCHGEWRHGICVLGAEDVHRAIPASDLFINKFDVALDSTGPICMRQILDERAYLPKEERSIGNEDKLPDIPPKSFFKASRVT